MRIFLIDQLISLQDTYNINIEYVEKYVEFCLINNHPHKIKGQTSAHHILPRTKHLPFAHYSNLSEYPWNKAELNYYHHYYAHYLLAKSINHISTLTAFCGMHNKDVALDRFSDTMLIDEAEFQQLYQDRNKFISQRRLELIEIDGEVMTRAAAIYKTIDWTHAKRKASERLKVDNPVYRRGVVEKIRQKKASTVVNGVPLDTLGAIKAATTMKQEFINSDGEVTTRYKENGKKISRSVNMNIITEQGLITTVAKERGRLRAQRYYSGTPMMCVVKSAFDPTYEVVMTVNEARRIVCGNICEKDKHNYLGKSSTAKQKLQRANKNRFIGLYAEILPSTHSYHTHNRNHNPTQ